VSEQPILWSDLIGYGKSDLHRIWEEQRNASEASIHQFSSDGGTSWSTPNTLSTLADKVVANHVSTDLFGNLFFLQLTGPDQPTMHDQRWNGSGWKLQPQKNLNIESGNWDPSLIASSISSSEQLVASVLGDSLDPKSTWKSQILSMAQFLETTEPIPTPYPALIAPSPVQIQTQTDSEAIGTPTPSSPLAGINDTQPFWSRSRNIIGLILLGLVVVFLVLILLSTARAKGNGKTKSG
jgi:hypothetical protein